MKSGMKNRIRKLHADLQAEDVLEEKVNFLGRITNENFTIMEAAGGVFWHPKTNRDHLKRYYQDRERSEDLK